MKFYLATGLGRGEEAKTLAAKLEEMGHKISYAWWLHGSVQEDGPEKIAEVAHAEATGVKDAELFVALLPGGRGTHTELGMAIAFAETIGNLQASARFEVNRKIRRIIIVGPLIEEGRECAFYRHSAITHRFDTVPELLAWLRGLAEVA